jgi:hypothetical protein
MIELLDCVDSKIFFFLRKMNNRNTANLPMSKSSRPVAPRNSCYEGMTHAYTTGTNHQFGWDGRFRTIYPPQPDYSPGCAVNNDWDTLPEGYPMRHTSLGPNSLKKLYEGPLYYPPQRMAVPNDTLYGIDTGTERPHGIRRTYGFMLYPFRQRSPNEVRQYSTDIIPEPRLQDWTSRHISDSDGYWGR